MRFSSIALAAAAAGSAFGASMTICDKYTVALLKDITPKNQLTLLSLLVNTAVIGNFTGPTSNTTAANAKLPGSMVELPGILAKGKVMGTTVNLLPYFDGSLVSTNVNNKAKAVNWLDGGGPNPIIADAVSPGKSGSNQATLLMHLYSYFGTLLGCSTVGKGAFPAYEGELSMFEVHRFMDLSLPELTWFVGQVGLAAESFGVTAKDAKAAGGALMSLFGSRCAPKVAVGNEPKELQSICVARDCPKACKADCGAYPKVSAPSMASSGKSSSSGGSSGGSSGKSSSGGSGGGSGAASSLSASSGLAIVGVAAAAAALL